MFLSLIEPRLSGENGLEDIDLNIPQPSLHRSLLDLSVVILFLTGIVFIITGIIRLIIFRKDKSKTKTARKRIIKGIVILLASVIIWTILALLTPFP